MIPLQIETGGRTLTFDGTGPVTIGRDPQCDITLTGDTVSRRHAELRPDASGWTLVDVGSSSGTFNQGTRVTEMRLTGHGTVHIGGAAGEALTYSVAGARPAPAMDPTALPAAGLDQTVLPGGAVPGSFVPGPALLVRSGGQSRRFVPGTTVRIGRDPANEVVADDSSVSRLHGVVESRPDGWWYVDRSTAGTFDGEDRVTTRKVTGPLKLMLGHPTAGIEVEVVPIVAAQQAQKEIAGKKRKRTALLVGGLVAALVLVGGGVTAAVLLSGDDEGGDGNTPTAVEGLTHEELDRAKAATVFLIAVVDGEPQWTGSGSIISDDGYILTNAHVADPGAPGFEPAGEQSPDYLIVGVPPAGEPDSAVELRFQARPVATDGPLDLSVLKIDADQNGDPVEGDLELPPPLPVGDSETVSTGDELVALGFPGLASVDLEDPFARPVTVTEGVASTIKAVPPFGDDAWIESDLRLGSGNSGGPTINDDGEIIGINTEVRTRETQGDEGEGGVFTSGSALMRPAKWTAGLIEAAEAGTPYTSEWLDEVGAEEPPPDMQADATIQAGGWSVDGKGGCATPSTTDQPQILAGATFPGTVFAEFAAVGVPDGTPLTLTFLSLDGATQLGSSPGTWQFGAEEACVAFPVDLAESIQGVIAVLTIGDLEVANPVMFQ